ncbi:MAG: hypothetical protein V4487_02570 [Chlamydiota bacterium]
MSSSSSISSSSFLSSSSIHAIDTRSAPSSTSSPSLAPSIDPEKVTFWNATDKKITIVFSIISPAYGLYVNLTGHYDISFSCPNDQSEFTFTVRTDDHRKEDLDVYNAILQQLPLKNRIHTIDSKGEEKKAFSTEK